MQKKTTARKKQPDRSKTRKAPGTRRAKKKVNGNNYLPWFVGLVLACAALAIWLLLPPLDSSADENSFDEKRIELNKVLKEGLEKLGINPKDRPVHETRDKLTDGDFSWDVLNWRVRVDPNFDFPYSRLRLEQQIRDIGCQHNSLWNFDDESIPLKIEAYVNDRLSHRIFFTIEEKKKTLFTAEYPAEEKTDINGNHTPKLSSSNVKENSIESRWEVIKGERLILDKQIQSVLSRNNLNGPPLLLTEYWSRENEVNVANWVISVFAGEDLEQLQADLEQNTSGATIRDNYNRVAGKTKKVLEISTGGSISHRLIFTTYINGLGKTSSNDEDLIYISKPRVAIIIDDIGYDVQAAESLMSMGVSITLSILPHRPHSAELALRARKNNYEVMLHLPMEPVAYPKVKPGAGAIYASLSHDEVVRITEENILAVPYATGVNNHMGSRAMTHSSTVTAVLEVVRSKGLYFVDSRTIGNTLGYSLARSMNVPSAERSVFIDKSDKADYQYSIERLREVISKALEQGSCVAIGHPSQETINAIKNMKNEFDNAGIELVFASSLVN